MGFTEARRTRTVEVIGKAALVLLAIFYLSLLVYYLSDFGFSVLIPDTIGLTSLTLSILEAWAIKETAPGVQASMAFGRVLVLLMFVWLDILSNVSGLLYIGYSLVFLPLTLLAEFFKRMYGI